MNDTAPITAAPARIIVKLSAREEQIALALATGSTNREIASALGISIKTVDTHRGHILKKLACRNNVALVLYMVRNGFVTP